MRRALLWAGCIAAAATMALCGCALGRGRPPEQVDRPQVRDIHDVQRRLLAADAASHHMLLGEIGRISSAGLNAPVWRMAYRCFRGDLKRILVLAGTRGTDVAGVQTALEVIDRRAAEGPDTGRFDLDVIPLVNPWGYVFDLGTGKNGTDIERDFVAFASAEARVIRRFLVDKRYDLVIVLREAPEAEGFTMVQYGFEDTSAAMRIAERLASLGHAPSRDAPLGFSQPGAGVAVAPLWRVRVMRLTRTLGPAGYIRENCSPLVFAVETPLRLPPADRVAILGTATRMLIDEFGRTAGSP